MSGGIQALSALLVELEDMNKLLNEYEKTKNTKLLSQVAAKIKTNTPKVKDVLNDPSLKNSETKPLLLQLKNGFKDAFSRAKAYKEGKASADKGDEEETASPPAARNNNNNSNTNGKHKEEDEDKEKEKKRSEERERERERERKKRDEEKEKQRREEKKRAEEEDEKRKNEEKNRVVDEVRKREDAAKKEFEEEEARDKELRRQAYLKKKEEEAKRAEQAKRIMDSEEGDGDEETQSDLRAKFRGKDIWSSILKDQEVKSQAEYAEGKFGESDYTLIFVGSKNSGKSTLIQRFLEKPGDPKPSTALEYSYGRHAKTSGISQDMKEIVHTWELAGGTSLAPLFDVTLTPEYMQKAVVVVVLDLSEPATIMETLLRWMDTIRSRAENCLKTLEKTNQPLCEGLRQAAHQNYPETHPDRETVKPLLVPTIIVGTKYDLFQDFEAERRKVCTRALRYIANTNGASLAFLSAKESKDDGSFTKFRGLLNYYLFRTPHNRTAVTEYTKSIFVPAGADTFEAIGRAPYGQAKTGVPAWRYSFDQVFPPLEEKAQDTSRLEEDLVKFNEPAIDSLKLEKEKELERIRRLRAREQQSQAAAEMTPPRKKKFAT